MTKPIVVVGDVLLDVDIVGTSVRLSPEAPVPVVQDTARQDRPGGAALAALLSARDAHPVVLIAPVADDEAAGTIRDLLRDRIELVALPWTGSTPVKTRLRANDHPIARLDTGGARGSIERIPARAVAAIAESVAILVSDYGRGVTTDERVRALLAQAAVDRPVVWDPHPQGAPAVPGTLMVTPNENELFTLVDSVSDGSLTSIRCAAAELADRWRVGAVCVTLGARGAMLLAGDDAPLMVAGKPVTGSDTCGAGDSFAAAVTTALADGALPSEAVSQATAAARQFVLAGGAAAFDPLASEATEPAADLADELTAVRRCGGVVVSTGGCFDLLHAGHVATLEAARALGDFLVVCMNSDESVRRLKGPQRPLQCAEDRSGVLLALRCVDAVLVFDEDTPVEAIRRVRPDIWVKGGDYSGMPLPEAAVMAEWGGETVTVPYVTGKSTSSIVELAAASATR